MELNARQHQSDDQGQDRQKPAATSTPVQLEYAFCDDWLIFARDPQGQLYYIITEMWPEWEDLHDGADQEPDAVERYMLPIAQAKWDQLPWEPVDATIIVRAAVDTVTWRETYASGHVDQTYKLCKSHKREVLARPNARVLQVESLEDQPWCELCVEREQAEVDG